MKGLQCEKRLWLAVYEPDSPELVPEPGLQARFDAGHRVGEAAQRTLGPGVVISLADGLKQAQKQTQAAIESGAPLIFEASFSYRDIFVAVDALRRTAEGWILIEVKSTASVKSHHIWDIAVQVWVLEQSGISVARCELMHLNTGATSTHESLFVRKDVSAKVQSRMMQLPQHVERIRSALTDDIPNKSIGRHCTTPYRCEFFHRCNPSPVDAGLHELYRVKAKVLREIEDRGVELIANIPDDIRLPVIANRQRRALQNEALVIEPNLHERLSEIHFPAVFIDFEAINPAIPPWPGGKPFESIPVQVSMHRLERDGSLSHTEWICTGRTDPRPDLARFVLEGLQGASSLVAYHASFEKRCIEQLIATLPEVDRHTLIAANEQFVDLLPIVREHVYHPHFRGSFGLKSVVRALLPDLAYSDLSIQSGDVASVELERLTLAGDEFDDSQRLETQSKLLDYCRRDTLVMVRLYQYLKAAI